MPEAGGASISGMDLVALVRSLAALPSETDWLELKRDNSDPEMIGRAVSALANSARLADRPHGYLIWGVADSDHSIMGSGFVPGRTKKGNEGLINWLTRLVDPPTRFQFDHVEIDGADVVVMTVEAAVRQPVEFQGRAHVLNVTSVVVQGSLGLPRAGWAGVVGLRRHRADDVFLLGDPVVPVVGVPRPRWSSSAVAGGPGALPVPHEVTPARGRSW